MEFFNDDEYLEKVFGCTKESIQKNEKEFEKIKTASERASNVRIFETGLFWSRSTYYWAFILAAFTAHFSLLKMLLEKNYTQGQEFFIFENFRYLSDFALICLSATAFICVLFCLAWVLMNKGSRFWQKNWEKHVNNLEKVENIRLFSTYLNPKNKDYKRCIFSHLPYDYSVSKLAFATSILLFLISLVIFVFYIVVMVAKFSFSISLQSCNPTPLISAIVFLILFGIALYLAFAKIPGNKHVKAKVDVKSKKDKWYQEDRLPF